MNLTAENVNQVLLSCLFKQGEPTDNPVVARGVMLNVGFHPERIQQQKPVILQMLKQLPIEFMKSGGGGYTFLNGCLTRDGEQWGDQRSVDELLCLGIASGLVQIPIPKEMWDVLPGGVPYFTVLDI